ncbi:MAG: hypothetical protein U0269_21095 [Polyangiales bacterium]
MRFVLCASAILLAACGASVRADQDGGSTTPDGTAPRTDATVRDTSVVPIDSGVAPRDGGAPVDTGVPPTDSGVSLDSGLPPLDGGTIRGDARGEWRMTTFRFNLNGVATQLTDTNRSLPGDPANRYRINGTVDITSNRLAFAWGVLRNDHAFVSDPMVDIDEGYSLTAFYWNGMLDDVGQRFITGAVSLDYAFDAPNVLRLSSSREGWTALFVRDPRTALPVLPGMAMDGTALQISASTSDPFVAPRVALLWDVAGSAELEETSSTPVAFSGGGVVATYRMIVPAVGMRSLRTVGGVTVAFAHIVIYDDVDRSTRFNSSMAGGTGPDILRGVSPIGVAVRTSGAPDASFQDSPFRLLKEGWQFVNVERNSEPRPAVLVPYAMSNPVRPDVPVSETAVRRRILDLL